MLYVTQPHKGTILEVDPFDSKRLRLERISHRGILYYAFMALSGVGVLILSLQQIFLLSLILLAIIGFSLTAFIIIWDSALLELADEQVLGRVTSLHMFGGL
ncbi:hypothetical protein ACUL41_18985 [Virgibacillus natechei]|uniref:hypothetical protein n=1 Tax=Virgibacillus sp. CBA3643 TaxID=2942278 RepID=UPI0035A3BD37